MWPLILAAFPVHEAVCLRLRSRRAVVAVSIAIPLLMSGALSALVWVGIESGVLLLLKKNTGALWFALVVAGWMLFVLWRSCLEGLRDDRKDVEELHKLVSIGRTLVGPLGRRIFKRSCHQRLKPPATSARPLGEEERG